MAGKYVLRNSPPGQFHFVLKAGNGETIISSERYTSKGGALNGIESVKQNAPHDGRYERKTASDGRHMFNLKAAHRERIGTSETYSTGSERERSIASVKAYGAGATVDDTSNTNSVGTVDDQEKDS